MARKEHAERTRTKVELVSSRVSPELAQRIERFMKRMNDETPGLRVGRSDAIRVLLTKALDLEDKERP